MTEIKLTSAHVSTRPHSHTTKKQRQNQKKIARLGEIWPRFFTNPPLPLSLGIYEQLLKEVKTRRLEITESHIRQGLHAYVHRRVYQQALITNTHRYDQHGVITEDLSKEHKDNAKQTLRKSKNTAQAQKGKPQSQPPKPHADQPKPKATQLKSGGATSHKKTSRSQTATRPLVTYKKRLKKRQILPSDLRSTEANN